jgi:hypothetical protein
MVIENENFKDYQRTSWLPVTAEQNEKKVSNY